MSFFIQLSHLTVSVSHLSCPSPLFCITFFPSTVFLLPFLPPSFAHLLCFWAAMTEMQAEGEENAELNRDAQLGQRICLQRCVYVLVCVCLYPCICVCVRENLWQSETENESDKGTETDTESKAVRQWYNYAYCTWFKQKPHWNCICVTVAVKADAK